jgi:predicted RNase H-like HicB family nuclease
LYNVITSHHTADSVDKLSQELKTAADKVLESDIELFEKDNELKRQAAEIRDLEDEGVNP